MDKMEAVRQGAKKMRMVAFRASGQMTLGEMIIAVERASKTAEEESYVEFDFCYTSPDGIDSYRGFYDELALGWQVLEYPDEVFINDFLGLLKSAVGRTFGGWKGGDYVMTKDTPVWVDNPGESSSTAVIGVKDYGYKIMILTKHVDG